MDMSKMDMHESFLHENFPIIAAIVICLIAIALWSWIRNKRN